tara:strand:+ start:1034 stop:2536 length:1503 start_codon:yes stop_codon:yes gene_type:complete
MATFQPKTFTDFVTRLTARLVARTRLSDTEVGGVASTIIAGVAREFDDLHFQMVNLQRVWDIDTATGEDLDDRAADVNPNEIVRKTGTKASGTVSFHRTDTTSPVTIPASTVVKTGDGIKYTTTAVATIAAASASITGVAAVANDAGAAGNIDTIGLLSTDVGGPTGVSQIDGTVSGVDEVNNDSVFTGGQDIETDAQLRERIKSYLRSLSRGTAYSLKAAVLGTKLDDFGRIVSAEVEELTAPQLGEVIVYVDDGAGTIETTATATAEAIVTTATGGEVRLYLDQPPVVKGSTVTLSWYEAATTTTKVLVEGTAASTAGTYDYKLNRAQGKITLIPLGPNAIPDVAASAVNVAGLQPGDSLSATYNHYTGLIQEAQKIIDGDVSDRTNYPGYRAAGTDVQVLAPVVYYQTISATVVVDEGYTASTITVSVASAIQNYINGLPINGDVIASELVFAAQSIDGVFDIQFTSGGLPITLTNTIIGAGELARIRSSAISITGA